MIWLQEYGTKTGANRPDYKLFYCENDSDVAYAPTLTKITYLGVDYRLTNGSTIYFMDSKQVKIYSEENATWYDV